MSTSHQSAAPPRGRTHPRATKVARELRSLAVGLLEAAYEMHEQAVAMDRQLAEGRCPMCNASAETAVSEFTATATNATEEDRP